MDKWDGGCEQEKSLELVFFVPDNGQTDLTTGTFMFLLSLFY